MKFYAINGSPRKNGNTGKLLKESLKGIEDKVKEKSPKEKVSTEIINLYPLDFIGCKSCFACKKKKGKHYGECPIKDDLKSVLKKLRTADGVIIGSPIYFADLTGLMRSFLERFFFPNFKYTDSEDKSIAEKRMPIGTIYTMNVPKDSPMQVNYDKNFDILDYFFESIYTKPYKVKSCDTVQFKDYSKYEASCFDEKNKLKHKKEQFPIDLKNAYEMGEKIGKDALKKL